jgi:Ion channel
LPISQRVEPVSAGQWGQSESYSSQAEWLDARNVNLSTQHAISDEAFHRFPETLHRRMSTHSASKAAIFQAEGDLPRTCCERFAETALEYRTNAPFAINVPLTPPCRGSIQCSTPFGMIPFSKTHRLILIHIVEIAVWALVFWLQNCLPNAESAFYFSGVTYATLGYGDLLLPKEWRLFGPLEALTGNLMVGLSIAFFFVVVSKKMLQRMDEGSRT